MLECISKSKTIPVLKRMKYIYILLYFFQKNLVMHFPPFPYLPFAVMNIPP